MVDNRMFVRIGGEWYKVPRKNEYLNILHKFDKVCYSDPPFDFVEWLKNDKIYFIGLVDDIPRYFINIFLKKRYHINSTPWTIILNDFNFDFKNEIWINRIT
jgi:hypothetical protein